MAKSFVGNLGGGMNTRATPFLVQPTEILLGRNISLDQIGAISKRAGYGTAVVVQSGKKMLGLHEYVITSSGTIYLLAITNNAGDTNATLKYAQIIGDGFTAHADANTQTLLANANYEFANFVDACFIVGYDDTTAAFEQFFTITGTVDGSYSSSLYMSGAPNAKYIIQSHDRIFIANTSNSSNELFWSDLPTGNPGSWALAWTSTNNTRVETNNGEQITGLGRNFNRVLVFKPSSIHKWDPDNEELVKEDGTIGSTHHRSIKNIGTATLFYKEGFGFYSYTQGEPQLISQKIDDWVQAIPRDTPVAAGVDARHYYAAVGSITLNNRTYSNVVLVYDTLLNAWSVLDNINASVIVNYGQGTAKTPHFGGKSDGSVYEMFSYTTTSTSSSTSSTSSTSSSTSSTSSTSSSTSSTSTTTT